MRNKTIVVAVILALVSAMILANVALAVQLDKAAKSPPGKANGGKAKGKAAVSTDQVNGDVGDNIKCTILHKGEEEISVSLNALPAHVLNHGDTLVGAAEELEDTQEPEDTGTEEPEDTGELEDAEEAEDVEQLEECQTLYDALVNTDPGTTDPNPSGTAGTTSTLQPQQSRPDEGTQGEDTETVQSCDGESIELSKAEKLTLDLHNETRKENELKELCVDPTLQKAARAHTIEMIKEDYFGHNSRDGKTSGQRLKGLGYNWRATGENLARGSGSLSKPKSRFEAWMRSDRHRGNILNDKYEEVGIGIASGQLKEGGQKQTVYTVDFATKKKKKK